MMIREQPDGEDEEEEEEDELDPRVEVELENLNKSSNDINILEKELDEARANFRQQLTDAARNLKALANSLGNNIDKARPYFEALSQAKKAQQVCIDAAMTYERAVQLHKGARETISVAEEKLMMNPGMFDAAWQEMLNNANIKIMEAEKEKLTNETKHQDAMMAYTELENRKTQLEKQLKKAVNKARPYFDQKAQYLGHLEVQKERVGNLEKSYAAAKAQYSQSLRNLELISEDIHRKRNKGVETPPPTTPTPIATREEGVGAETATKSSSRRRSVQRRLSEDRINKALVRHSSEIHRRTGRFRSSLLIDLDVDFDLDDSFDESLVAVHPKSPSTKSVDIGCVNMRYYDDYQVLDVTPFLERERRKSRPSVEAVPEHDIPVFTDLSSPSTSPSKSNAHLKIRSYSTASEVSSEFSNLEMSSQSERKISQVSTSSIDNNFQLKPRSGTTHSEFEVIPHVTNLDLSKVVLRTKSPSPQPLNRFSMIAEMDSDEEEIDALDNISVDFEGEAPKQDGEVMPDDDKDDETAPNEIICNNEIDNVNKENSLLQDENTTSDDRKVDEIIDETEPTETLCNNKIDDINKEDENKKIENEITYEDDDDDSTKECATEVQKTEVVSNKDDQQSLLLESEDNVINNPTLPNENNRTETNTEDNIETIVDKNCEIVENQNGSVVTVKQNTENTLKNIDSSIDIRGSDDGGNVEEKSDLENTIEKNGSINGENAEENTIDKNEKDNKNSVDVNPLN